MSEIAKLIRSPVFWFTSVALALIISVAGNLLTKWIERRYGGFTRRRQQMRAEQAAHSEAYEADWAKELTANQYRMIDAIVESHSKWLLREIAVLVGATVFFFSVMLMVLFGQPRYSWVPAVVAASACVVIGVAISDAIGKGRKSRALTRVLRRADDLISNDVPDAGPSGIAQDEATAD